LISVKNFDGRWAVGKFLWNFDIDVGRRDLLLLHLNSDIRHTDGRFVSGDINVRAFDIDSEWRLTCRFGKLDESGSRGHC
jgi:hypothetical protein